MLRISQNLPYYQKYDRQFNTYSMENYVQLHFEQRNDVTIIVKLLYRATSRMPVVLWILMMIVTSFYNILDECHKSWCKMSQYFTGSKTKHLKCFPDKVRHIQL